MACWRQHRSQAARWRRDDWAKVVEAAKKEGKLVIYTASIGSVFHKAVIKSFEQKYGITRRNAGGARQRSARAGAGRAVGRPLPGRHPSQRQHDHLADEPRRQLPAARARPQHQEHRAALRGRRHPHPVRGHQLLPDGQPQPGEAGRRAQELEGHPRSQMVGQDPVRRLSCAGRRRGVLRRSCTTPSARSSTRSWRRRSRCSRATSQNSERRVARGEFPLYLPFSLQNYNNLKGLPIKPIVPAEGRPYVAST